MLGVLVRFISARDRKRYTKKHHMLKNVGLISVNVLNLTTFSHEAADCNQVYNPCLTLLYTVAVKTAYDVKRPSMEPVFGLFIEPYFLVIIL